MREESFKPEGELLTVWILVWFISYLVAMIGAVAPWLAESIFGAEINGSLPTLIMAASFTAIMLPFLIWLPAYKKSLEYWLGEKSVKGKRGVFWKRIVTVPYEKVTNIDITQGPLQRAFGIGNLHVQTAGASASQGGGAELVIYGVRDLDGLRETIMDRIASAEGQKPHHLEASQQDTLELMLDELRAIRRLTEDRK
jgi:membrane protein YdbS with pleckstrin-like domain